MPFEREVTSQRVEEQVGLLSRVRLDGRQQQVPGPSPDLPAIPERTP